MSYCGASEIVNLCIICGENPPLRFDLKCANNLRELNDACSRLGCMNIIYQSSQYHKILHLVVKITCQRAPGCTVVVHQLYMTAITVTNLNCTVFLFCTGSGSNCTVLYLDSSCTGVQSPTQTVQHPVDHCGWHAVPGAAGCSTLKKLY